MNPRYIIFIIFGLFVILAAVSLIKANLIDPKKVREAFSRMVARENFEPVGPGSPPMNNMKSLMEIARGQFLDAGQRSLQFNVKNCLVKEEKGRKFYLADVVLITHQSRSSSNNPHLNLSSNYHLNLMIQGNMKLPATAYIRRKYDSLAEKLAEQFIGKGTRIPGAVSGFEDKFFTLVAPQDKASEIVTRDIQDLLMEYSDKYPFILKKGKSTTVGIGRDVTIFEAGILISADRTWKLNEIRSLYEFGKRLLQRVEKHTGSSQEKQSSGEQEDIYRVDL